MLPDYGTNETSLWLLKWPVEVTEPLLTVRHCSAIK